MRNLIIALALLTSTAAVAQEVTPVVRSIAQEVTPLEKVPADEINNVTILAGKFTKVCESKFVLTEKAQGHCTKDDMPRVLKSGTRFANRGAGSEFNTLIRNLAIVTE